MSARRSSGVQRARGGSGWRWLPTTANSVPCASRSRRSVCQSPPLSVARQKHCGVRWAWMSMARITLLSRAPSIIRPPSGGMPVAMAAALLEVRDLRTYIHTRRGVVKAVDGATFAVRRGETLGIVGESGSGKSMTCLSILRLVPEPGGRIVGGQILFDGEDLLAKTPDEMRQLRGSRIAMILQDPMASLNPALTVGEQIAETLRPHRGLRGRAPRDPRPRLPPQDGRGDPPARGGPHRHLLPAEPAHRRRADDVARRDDPGP